MSDKFHTSVHATNEGVVLAHTLYGEPTSSHLRASQVGNPNIVQATWSTAPYIPPARRQVDSKLRDKPLCATEGCRAWATKTGYCNPHGRKLGLVPSCEHEGCGRIPLKGASWCRTHQPEPVVTEEDIFGGNPE